MSTSYIERGGSVGTNNPGDNNLKMQFWTGGDTAQGQKERDYKEALDKASASLWSFSTRPSIFTDEYEPIAA